MSTPLTTRSPDFTAAWLLAGGSFYSGSIFAKGQYTAGKNKIGGSVGESVTEHYLNPVVPQNYFNAGSLGSISGRYERDISSRNRLKLMIRHAMSNYEIPNEQVQQVAGQRQTADNIENMAIASLEHAFSPIRLGTPGIQ